MPKWVNVNFQCAFNFRASNKGRVRTPPNKKWGIVQRLCKRFKPISVSLNFPLQDQIRKQQTPFFFSSHALYLWIVFCIVIIHRVVAHEDPPFRPNIPSMEMKPEYIELMVDCWDDDPEERPHFYRIVERLKKISGRYRGASRRGWEFLTKFYTGNSCPEVKIYPSLCPFWPKERHFQIPPRKDDTLPHSHTWQTASLLYVFGPTNPSNPWKISL